MSERKIKIVLWLLLAAFLLVYPKLFGMYYVNLFVTFMVFAVFSLSFNMLLGFTGLLSFGHAIFFGISGYGTALALRHIEGISLFPAIGLGVLASVVLAAVLCPVVVRVTGTAFAMVHLAFGQLMYVLALKLRNVTGGEDGIGNFPIPDLSFFGLFSFPLKNNPVNFYYFALVVLGISAWLMWFFTKTPFGQIQVGIRDNAKRIDYLGFKVPESKSVIYITSAFFAGVAGSVYGLFHNLVSADGSLNVLVSFTAITATLIGGIGSFFGPIWGTAIFQILEELTIRFTEQVELVTGIIMILVIMYAPRGFAGFLATVKLKWQVYREGRGK